LRVQHYEELKRAGRGLIRRYVGKDDRTEPGADDAPHHAVPTRRAVKPPTYRPYRFPQRYTREDIVLLAAVETRLTER